MAANETYSKNQYGEPTIANPIPIGGSDGPLFKSGFGPQVFMGEGAPTIEAPENSIFIRTDGSGLDELLYVNTDGVDSWSPAALTGGAAGLSTPLTGFVSGAGTVSATDTILQGVDKLAGNMQNTAVISNVLTGLGAGSNTPIADTDTILEALANLQAQITALAP